jgi:hypothetical protein
MEFSLALTWGWADIQNTFTQIFRITVYLVIFLIIVPCICDLWNVLYLLQYQYGRFAYSYAFINNMAHCKSNL